MLCHSCPHELSVGRFNLAAICPDMLPWTLSVWSRRRVVKVAAEVSIRQSNQGEGGLKSSSLEWERVYGTPCPLLVWLISDLSGVIV
eukprot:3783806-Rhodomonas_salina.1